MLPTSIYFDKIIFAETAKLTAALRVNNPKRSSQRICDFISYVGNEYVARRIPLSETFEGAMSFNYEEFKLVYENLTDLAFRIYDTPEKFDNSINNLVFQTITKINHPRVIAFDIRSYYASQIANTLTYG